MTITAAPNGTSCTPEGHTQWDILFNNDDQTDSTITILLDGIPSHSTVVPAESSAGWRYTVLDGTPDVHATIVQAADRGTVIAEVIATDICGTTTTTATLPKTGSSDFIMVAVAMIVIGLIMTRPWRMFR